MAERIQVSLEDDLDGGTADETVTFGLDSKAYEIDLSGKNAAKLRKALAAYISAGRGAGRVPRQRGAASRPAVATGSQNAAEIRAWALWGWL